MMLRFFTILTGDRHDTLQKHGVRSRKKVIAIAMGLLLVTGLWFNTGYQLGNSVFQLTTVKTVILSVILAAMVFFIDRMIILQIGRSWQMAILRFFLALCMSFIGGIALEIVAFRDEIEKELISMHQETIIELEQRIIDQHRSKLAEAKADLLAARKDLAVAEDVWKSELNGTANGSGRYGNGPVAKAKEKLVQARMAEVATAENIVQEVLKEQRKGLENITLKMENEFASAGLLERLEALHRVSFSTGTSALYYVLLLCVLVILELSPLLVKLFFGETSYERGVELADQMQRDRFESVARMQKEMQDRRERLSNTERKALCRLKEVNTEFQSLN